MILFKTVKKSVWSPDFYAQQLENTSGAFAYYFKLALCLSFVVALGFVVTSGPKLMHEMNKLPAYVSATYPDGLEITLSDKGITTNEKEPYAVTLPSSGAEAENSKEPKNFIVFDTKEPFSVEAFPVYDTSVLVSKDAIAAKSDSFRLIPMSNIVCKQGGGENSIPCPFTLTKQKVEAFMVAVAPLKNFVIPVLAVLLFFGFMLLYTVSLLAYFVTAFVAYLVVKYGLKKTITYHTTYRLTLYASTLPLILSVVLMGVKALGVPIALSDGFWSSLVITVLVLFFNLRTPGKVSPSN